MSDNASPLDPKQLAEVVAQSVRDLAPELLGGMTPVQLGEMVAEMRAIKAAQEKFAGQRQADERSDNRKVSASLREYETTHKVEVEADTKGGKGLRAATYVRAIANGRIEGRSAQDVLRSWGYVKLAEEVDQIRALNSGTASAGGSLYQGGFLAELIELQRNMVAVRQIPGIRVLNMPNGTLTIKKQTGAGSAAYSGEGSPIASSQQTTGDLVLNGKKLTALTPVSNDLLRIADAQSDAFVRDDLAAIMAIREDLAFLRGDGTSGTPRGLRNSVASAMAVASAGNTADLVRSSLIAAMSRMAQRNVRFSPANAAFIMSERAKHFVLGLNNGLGLPAFPELANGMLLGYKVLSTNQVPDTLGGGTDTEVYFACGSEIVIGDVRGIELTAMDGAAYYNTPTTAVVSGFSQDETVIRAVSVHDIGLRHDNGVSIISGAAWGA